MPAFVTVERGPMRLYLSEHKGDARPDTLIYLSVMDVHPLAREFGVGVEQAPWGLEIEIRDPDGNRLRIGSPTPSASSRPPVESGVDGGAVVTGMRRSTPFLSTHDMVATIDFYTRLLGFRVSVRHPDDQQPTLVVLDHGEASIIFDSTLWPGQPTMTGQVHFDLGVCALGSSAVLALAERLKPHVVMLWGPEVYPYGRREFSCSDPNGYALVFSEPTDDPPTCPD